MADELSRGNAPALRILQTIFGAAAPFEVELQGSQISISIEKRESEAWPEPPPLGLSAREQGAWPQALSVRAEWAGGSTSLQIFVVRPARRTRSATRYHENVALVVETRSGSRLVWLNVPAAIAKEDGAGRWRRDQAGKSRAPLPLPPPPPPRRRLFCFARRRCLAFRRPASRPIPAAPPVPELSSAGAASLSRRHAGLGLTIDDQTATPRLERRARGLRLHADSSLLVRGSSSPCCPCFAVTARVATER